MRGASNRQYLKSEINLLNIVPKDDKSFDIVHIDQVDIFYSRVKAKKHVFVLIDVFMKFNRLYLTKNTASEEEITHQNIYIFLIPVNLEWSF